MRERELTNMFVGPVRARIARRTLLGGVLLTAACGPLRTTTDGSPRENDPDLAIVRRVIGAEKSILDRYDEARRLYPELATVLDPITAHHREHLAALQRRLGSARPSSPTPRPDNATPGAVVPAPTPDSPDLAVAALKAAEKAAARARTEDMRRASAALAQLLASVGASEASHAAILGKRR